MTTSVARGLGRIAIALLMAVMAGCATTGAGHAGVQAASAPRVAAEPKDPYESFNRKMFAFNDALDTYALKPAATAYQKVVPSPVRTGVHNVFGNFSDAWSTVNKLLQGKFDDGARMGMRVLTNTILGLGGILDPATDLGLERKSTDLGLTLGHWGLEPGPYLVLPVFGPSDFRDAIALPADDYVTPALLVDTTWQKIGVDALGVVDARSNLLGASQLLDDIALDRYSFLRDAYLARRRSQVYDGNPPDEPDADDADDGKSAPAPAGVASGAQGGMKPSAPAAPASGAKTSRADEPASIAAADAIGIAEAPAARPLQVADAARQPPDPSSGPAPSPVPSGVTPAPLPASAPTLPVPIPGPAPVPPPPASAAHA